MNPQAAPLPPCPSLSYTSRGFVVDGVELRGSLLLLPTAALLWKPSRLGDVTAASLSALLLLKQRPDLLLLGCGMRGEQPPPALRAELRAR